MTLDLGLQKAERLTNKFRGKCRDPRLASLIGKEPGRRLLLHGDALTPAVPGPHQVVRLSSWPFFGLAGAENRVPKEGKATADLSDSDWLVTSENAIVILKLKKMQGRSKEPDKSHLPQTL